MNTTVITIDGGTVEFPLDYMVRVQHMLKRADKLQKLWDVKEIMRRYNCPFPSLGVDVPSNMPHDIAVEKACLFIADFLREENIRSLMMPVAKFSSETCEEFNLEYTDEENAQYIRQCDFSKLDVGNYPEWNQAIMIHEEGLRLGNRGLATYRTGTYIVHPSVAALIANEATWQNIKATAKNYHEQAAYLYSKATEMQYKLVKDLINKWLPFYSKNFHTIINNTTEQALASAISISGTAAASQVWLEFAKAPCNPMTYVNLLKTCLAPTGLEELMSIFEVNKQEVYDRCRDILTQHYYNTPLNAITNSNRGDCALLISNLCQLQGITEESLFMPILSMRGKYIADTLVNIHGKLPREIKDKVMSEHQEYQEAEAIVSRYVSRDDFLFLQQTLGEEWTDSVRKTTSVNGVSTELYDLLVECVWEHIAKIRIYREKRDKALAKQTSMLNMLENDLSKCGILSFGVKKQIRQQIEEVNNSIARINADYSKAMQTL